MRDVGERGGGAPDKLSETGVAAPDKTPHDCESDAEADQRRYHLARELVNRLYHLGGEPSRGEGTDQPPVEDADERVPYPDPVGGVLCDSVADDGRSLIVIVGFSLATPIAVPVLDFQYLEGCRMNCRFDLLPLEIGTVDLVTAVIDLDPSHRPALLRRQGGNGLPRLPVGHRHEALVIGHRAADREGRDECENCQDEPHGALLRSPGFAVNLQGQPYGTLKLALYSLQQPVRKI